MTNNDTLFIATNCTVKAQNAGLFISRGTVPHPTRVINSHELIFVRQGTLDLWEEDRTFHLEAGQTLLLLPERRHGGGSPMPTDLRFYWIHFDITSEPVDAFLIPCAEPHMAIPQVATISQLDRLERLFRIFLEDQETGLLHPYAANLLTTLMLVEIVQSQVEPPPLLEDANAVATWAYTYIRMNYDRPITASKIAAALGYNTDYLGRVYRKLYGCTLTESIHRRRVEKASEWLLDTNLSITQIASRCGFSDTDYFRRVFRRIMNLSPSDYREEFSRVHVNTH